jgi:prepilin-type processing-associated H-X9-DG protein
MRPRHPAKAFTLIDLVAVLFVAALLVVPLASVFMGCSTVKTEGGAEGRPATGIARYNACKANMKMVSTAWFGFAAGHQDRFPGQAKSTVESMDVCWMQILNREFYRGNDQASYPTTACGDEPPIFGPLIRMWNFWDDGNSPRYVNKDLGRKYMTCTEYRAWGTGKGNPSNIWSRPWIANDHAVGGHYYSPSNASLYAPGGLFYQDGIVVPDARVPNQAYRSPGWYVLGRRTDTWANASTKYLMWEAEAAIDMDRYEGGDVNGTLTLNDSRDHAPWTAIQGRVAFRHMRPSDQSLWQREAHAPVLYVDGHVGEWNPNAPQYTSRNFNVGE